jgi:hypothetical protein
MPTSKLRRYSAFEENELWTLSTALTLADDGTFSLERTGLGAAAPASDTLHGTFVERPGLLVLTPESGPAIPLATTRGGFTLPGGVELTRSRG